MKHTNHIKAIGTYYLNNFSLRNILMKIPDKTFTNASITARKKRAQKLSTAQKNISKFYPKVSS